MNELFEMKFYLISVFSNDELIKALLLIFPFILLIELPYYLLLICAIMKKWLQEQALNLPTPPYHPLVSVVVIAYAEKEAIYKSLDSLIEQLYPGTIEILIVIDDATNNAETVTCVERYKATKQCPKNRHIKVIKKRTRGGLANTRNVGLYLARGEVLIVLDADTSLDNTCVHEATKPFREDCVIALSGVLRVRNAYQNTLCRIQAMEYQIGVELGRYGLAQMKVLNNISGAFGIFRVSTLRRIGGWVNGTAEDLDLMLRLHAYAHRYPHLRIAYATDAIAYTFVPDTIKDFFKQRMRWEGDLFYIYVRRHWRSFSIRLMGFWRSFITIWYGLFYQITLPFVVTLYYIYLILTYSLGIVFGIFIITYLYYLLICVFFYLLYCLVIKNTTIKQLYFLPILFIMPLFQMIYRLLTVYFILNEMLFKGHLDTSMAPWWIIKRTK